MVAFSVFGRLVVRFDGGLHVLADAPDDRETHVGSHVDLNGHTVPIMEQESLDGPPADSS